ncbi:hypothetical protein HK096_005643 [Nowakowskiella sp. JEL0078]|nr:hypothetical protein HK096_005643 [Nowakowskiella sp. JEL0078]
MLVKELRHLEIVASKPEILTDEFLYSFDFSLVKNGCLLGFLPMASPYNDSDLLLLKLHHQRCLISPLSDIHYEKNLKRTSKKYFLSVDKDFDGVVEGCKKQHPDCWLYPNLLKEFKRLFTDEKYGPVQFHSFELWKKHAPNMEPTSNLRYNSDLSSTTTNMEYILVAGELGYSVGSCYTSLTGFATESGSGTVQLCSTGKLLANLGFQVWDLGMEIAYKMRLGARNVERKDWLKIQQQSRGMKTITVNLNKENLVSSWEIIYGKAKETVVYEDVVMKTSKKKKEGNKKPNSAEFASENI